jgi:transposase-like protein
LPGRDLSSYDIIAIMIDGKSFSQDDLIVAVGVSMQGSRIILGFIEAATENAQITGHFLRQLLDRGLGIDEGVFVVVDGSKGLIAAIKKIFAGKGLIQRCQWHKRENMAAYVSKAEQPFLRKRLQHAYERLTIGSRRRRDSDGLRLPCSTSNRDSDVFGVISVFGNSGKH